MKRIWLLYCGMFLASTLAPLGSTMIAVALPSIGSELGIASGPLTVWLVSTYFITGIAAMTPSGKLGDLIGHERCLVIGMLIYGIGSAGGFVFANLPMLAIARISMALGAAMAVPATLALIRSVIPLEKRPRAFGYFGSVMSTAAAIGPLVGGELTAVFGWRSVFIANLPVIFLALALIRMSHVRPTETPAAPETTRPRFDIEGSALLGVALTLLVIAPQLSVVYALACGVIGTALLAIFIVWERRTPEPVLDLQLFTNRHFLAAGAVIALQNLIMYGLLFQLPIFFEQVRGFSPGTTGRAIVFMMVAMVVSAPIGGRLSEKFGVRNTVFIGCLAALAGIYLIGNFQSVYVYSDVFGALVLIGLGLGLSVAPSQSAAMSAIERSKSGMAGGAISTARYIGGVIGIAALGYLLHGNGSLAAHGAAVALYALAILLAAGAALLLPGSAPQARRA